MARRNARVVDESDEIEVETAEEEAAEEVDLLDQLSWDEPPARTRSPRTGKWAKVFDALREHEGQWARIDVKAKAGTAAALAGNLRSGTLAGAEKGEFEATSRRLPDDTYGVFARYNPNAADEAEADEAEDEYEDSEYVDEDE